MNEQRAAAAEYGVTFRGHEDDPASPAAALASLDDNYCMRLYADMLDIETNGGDLSKFARYRDALTRRVHQLGRGTKPTH